MGGRESGESGKAARRKRGWRRGTARRSHVARRPAYIEGAAAELHLRHEEV